MLQLVHSLLNMFTSNLKCYPPPPIIMFTQYHILEEIGSRVNMNVFKLTLSTEYWWKLIIFLIAKVQNTQIINLGLSTWYVPTIHIYLTQKSEINEKWTGLSSNVMLTLYPLNPKKNPNTYFNSLKHLWVFIETWSNRRRDRQTDIQCVQ